MKSLSFTAKFYLVAIYVIGIVILIFHLNRIDISHPLLLITVCVLASLTLILKVEGSTNRSHYSFNFLIYGFTFAVLGTSEAILVILVSNLVEWIWNRQVWFIQLFNTAGYIIVMQLGGIAYSLINPSQALDTWQTVAGISVAMITFNVLNHLFVAIVIWLARGENFKQSGVFDFFPFVLDLALLVFGASLSFVWNYNAAALSLFLIPIYLIYSTLRVPALERKTEVDSKTGLFNHEYFQKQLNNELARANRFDRPMSVILADLDLLRNINNTYGHLAGDEVLMGIAQAMKKAVRDYDVVCRFGGEEFAILLPETTVAQAFQRAEVIRKTVEDMEFSIATSITPIRATLSLGVAHRENFRQTQQDIIHNADLALYHSKLSGRNRCFAILNDSYVDFLDVSKLSNLDQPSSSPPGGISIPVTMTKSSQPESITPAPMEGTSSEAQTESTNLEEPVTIEQTKKSRFEVNLFISGIAFLAILAVLIVSRWSPISTNLGTLYDWLGLIVIAIMIGFSEGFSIDLYVKQSSVSTSAIPILVAYLLFGTAGIILASLVVSISSLIKYRSPISRFIFNLSNHLLAGSMILAIMLFIGKPLLGLPTLFQIGMSLLSAILMYLITTWMVAVGVSVNLNQRARQLWKDQFGWLAPYYLGIGLITYSLIFGYNHDRIMGLLLMASPMVLLRISQKQYIDRTREVVTELREKNQILKKNSEEILELNEGLLATLSEIIDIRDPYVLGHSKQVSKYATQIARILGLNEKQVELIRKAGLLHDIGKLGVSMEILTKPGKLTPEEYRIVQEHAALGGDLIKSSPSLRPLGSIIRHHHEFYNGRGYPDKLAGNQISIEARIVSVADAIEAMISERPYRRALSVTKITDELKRCSGSQFDPLVVDAAMQILEGQAAKEIVSHTQQAASILDLSRSVQFS